MPLSRRHVFTVLLAVIAAGCKAAATSSTDTLTSVAVTPTSQSIAAGTTFQLNAQPRDQNGNALAGHTVTWSSANIAIATVSSTGLVTGVTSGGPVTISATSDGQTGTAMITVTPVPVATVSVTPLTPATTVGGTTQLTASVLDAASHALDGRTITWSTSSATIATVSSTGLVTGVGAGTATITATAEGKSGSAVVTVSSVPVATVAISGGGGTVGTGFTLALQATLQDAGGHSLIGRTVTWSSSNSAIASVNPTTGLVTGVTVGGPVTITAASEGKSATTTVSVVIGMSALAGSYFHFCGLTGNGSAYCWGNNVAGQLGDGTTNAHTAAVAVLGGLHFGYLAVGFQSSCGIVTGGTGATWCWGSNIWSEAGDGGTTFHSVPSPAASGLALGAIQQQDEFTCANSITGAPYCWGFASAVVLPTAPLGRAVPNAVSSPVNLTVQPSQAGSSNVCGLTTAGVAYCWGANQGGGLGNNTTAFNQPTPMPVVTSLTFTQLSVSIFYTCGVATGGAAYCWGRNTGGVFGDGTTTDKLTPAPVSGGLTFKSIATANSATCAIATDGTAYCWGQNTKGILGDGTSATSHLVPMPVAGSVKFSSVVAGATSFCALSVGGAPYCWGDNSNSALGIGTIAAEADVPTAVSFVVSP